MTLHTEHITYVSTYLECASPDCGALSEEITRDLDLTDGNLVAAAAAIGWQWDSAIQRAYCALHRSDAPAPDGLCRWPSLATLVAASAAAPQSSPEPDVEVAYACGDTSVLEVDGDDLRAYLRHEYGDQGAEPLDVVAHELGLGDYLAE